MPVRGFEQTIWLAGFLGHAVLLCVLLLKHRAAKLPLFTGFVATNLMRSVTLFLVLRFQGGRAYSFAYWSFGMVDLFMQCVLAYELGYKVFRPAGRWAPDVRRGWFLLLLVTTSAALLLAALAPGSYYSFEHALINRGSIFASALIAQIFVGLLVLSGRAGLPWDTHAGKVVRALGLYAIFDLFLLAIHILHLDDPSGSVDVLLFRTRGVLYLTCLVYWIAGMWENAPEFKKPSSRAIHLLGELGSHFPFPLKRN